MSPVSDNAAATPAAHHHQAACPAGQQPQPQQKQLTLEMPAAAPACRAYLDMLTRRREALQRQLLQQQQGGAAGGLGAQTLSLPQNGCGLEASEQLLPTMSA